MTKNHTKTNTKKKSPTAVMGGNVEKKNQKLPTAQTVATTGGAKPTQTDIVLGRGNGVGLLPGNCSFRVVVQSHRAAYKEAKRRDKVGIAKLVIQQMKQMDPPGRFLEYSNTRQQYVEVENEKRVIEKVCQALRDIPNKRKQQQKKKAEDALQTTTSPLVGKNSTEIGTLPTEPQEVSSTTSSPNTSGNDMLSDADIYSADDYYNAHTMTGSNFALSSSPSFEELLSYPIEDEYVAGEEVVTTSRHCVSPYSLFSSRHRVVTPTAVSPPVLTSVSTTVEGARRNTTETSSPWEDIVYTTTDYPEPIRKLEGKNDHHQQPMSLWDSCFCPYLDEGTNDNRITTTVQNTSKNSPEGGGGSYHPTTATTAADTSLDEYAYWVHQDPNEETLVLDLDEFFYFEV